MAGLIDLVQTLTTPHTLDRYLELVHPTLTVRDMRAEIVEVDRDTRGSVTLTLRPTRQWRGHRAGQYVQIGVLIDGVKHTRCYSPIDPQGDGGDRQLRLTVKAHPNGLVSQYLRRRAEPGMVVDLAPATGNFTLPEPHSERIVLISGGSGITPVLSMLRTLDAREHRGQVVFLHYARSPEMVPHRAELEQIAQRRPNFRIALGYPGTWPSEVLSGAPWSCAASPISSRFGYDQLERIAPWFATAQTYLCGPASLMDAVRTVYEAEGLENRLRTEEFTFTAVPVRPDEVGGTTTFSASGVAAENTGVSLLEQAESAGLTPEHGCRMGICMSCTAIKRSGCVRNLRTGELDADPDHPIQLCINAAVGDARIDI